MEAESYDGSAQEIVLEFLMLHFSKLYSQTLFVQLSLQFVNVYISLPINAFYLLVSQCISRV